MIRMSRARSIKWIHLIVFIGNTTHGSYDLAYILLSLTLASNPFRF